MFQTTLSARSALLAASLFIAFGASAENLPTKQAREKGVSACVEKIDQIAEHLTKNNKDYWTNTTTVKNGANKRLFNSQLIINYSDGPGAVVMNVAQSPSGKCDGTYTRVITFEKSCITARESDFKSWTYITEKGGGIALNNSEISVDAMLLPVGPANCVAVLTEVVYN